MMYIVENQADSDVIVTDGKYYITCFAQREYTTGEVINLPLLALTAHEVVRSEFSKDNIVKDSSSYYAFRICGVLKAANDNIVSVGEILFKLPNIPKDINAGERVSALISRADII